MITTRMAITRAPVTRNGTNPGDHNGTFEYAVHDFNSTHLFELTGSESASPRDLRDPGGTG